MHVLSRWSSCADQEFNTGVHMRSQANRQQSAEEMMSGARSTNEMTTSEIDVSNETLLCRFKLDSYSRL
jgi:hypothetical protein